MPEVQTVTGPVDAAQLGPTLVHEHCRFRDEATADQWPDRYDEAAELEVACAQVRAAMAHGVRTICDPTAMFGGRDFAFLQAVARATGANIVGCTGIYTYDYLPHYFESRDVDLVADHFVHDLEVEAMGSGARAGFLKCAADAPGVTPNVEKVHRAVARASVRTGAPIMAHSRPADRTGLRQVEVLLEEGVAPERIQIAHCGDTDDLEYLEAILATGVWIGLDRFGLDLYFPMDKRLDTAAELLRRGYADRIMLGADHCATIDWFTPEQIEQLVGAGAVHPNWSMTTVFEDVLPPLRERGAIDDAAVTTMLEDNPRRWLSGA